MPRQLTVVIDTFDRLPDVLIADPSNNWLFLIEAVRSHGPSDKKRYDALAHLFRSSRTDLIYVSAFPTRRDMARYVPEILWQPTAGLVLPFDPSRSSHIMLHRGQKVSTNTRSEEPASEQ